MKRTWQNKKRPHYSNILMVDIEGTPLSSISDRKAKWFISRSLAKEIQPQNGFERTIQLTFKNQPAKPQVWELNATLNRCVICGKTSELTLHHVIPYLFRRHFAAKDKDHSRQWCVLLCEDHHQEAEILMEDVYRKQIPVHQSKNAPTGTEFSRAGFTLVRLKSEGHLSQIPTERLVKLLAAAGFSSESDIPMLSAEEISNAMRRIGENISKNHQKAISDWVHSFIEQHGGVDGIKELFRNVFLNMKPRFLPLGYLEIKPKRKLAAPAWLIERMRRILMLPPPSQEEVSIQMEASAKLRKETR